MITLQTLFPLAIIKYMRFLSKGQMKLGSSLSLPAYGREGQGQHLFLAAHFAKRNTKFGGGGGKRGRGGNSFPPNPLSFPPRPSVQFGARSAPSVLFKKGSDFVKQTHHKVERALSCSEF